MSQLTKDDIELLLNAVRHGKLGERLSIPDPQTPLKLKKGSSRESLAILAVTCGYSIKTTAGGAPLLIPPNHSGESLTITNQLRESTLRSYARKVLRHAEPDAAKILLLAIRQREDAVVESPAAIGTQVQPEDHAPDEGPVDEPSDPVCVSTTPRPTRTGRSGVYYQSGAVLERLWSDGSVDHQCSLPGCDYASANPRSVANHYARSEDHDPSIRGALLEGPEYQPDSRIGKLRAELARAWPTDVDTNDLDDLLDALAHSLAEQRRKEHAVEPPEPLTDAQRLDRIMAIADGGRLEATKASLAQALADKHAAEERLGEAEAQNRALLEQNQELRTAAAEVYRGYQDLVAGYELVESVRSRTGSGADKVSELLSNPIGEEQKENP